MWTIIKDIDFSKNPVLALAVQRFNSAYSEYSLEDKIIDYAISYEVLFSRKSDGTDSVGHKLALRFSRLYVENADKRKSVYYDIKDQYGVRSKIVHGTIKKNDQTVSLCAKKMEEFMRISIRKYIDKFKTGNYANHDKLIEELDFG